MQADTDRREKAHPDSKRYKYARLNRQKPRGGGVKSRSALHGHPGDPSPCLTRQSEHRNALASRADQQPNHDQRLLARRGRAKPGIRPLATIVPLVVRPRARPSRISAGSPTRLITMRRRVVFLGDKAIAPREARQGDATTLHPTNNGRRRAPNCQADSHGSNRAGRRTSRSGNEIAGRGSRMSRADALTH